MLEGLKMGWVFKKPARLDRPSPSDESHHGLDTVSPLLGEISLHTLLLHLLTWRQLLDRYVYMYICSKLSPD